MKLYIILLFILLNINLLFYAFFNVTFRNKNYKGNYFRLTFAIVNLLLAYFLFAWSYTRPSILSAITGSHPVNAEDIFTDKADIEFSEAVINGDLGKIAHLVDQGIDVNKTGRFNISPLYLAFYYEQREAFAFLLDNQAEININVESGGVKNAQKYQLLTSFLSAVMNDPDPFYLEQLLDHGLNPNCRISDSQALVDELFHNVFGVTRSMVTYKKRGTPPSYAQRKDVDSRKLRVLLRYGLKLTQESQQHPGETWSLLDRCEIKVGPEMQRTRCQIYLAAILLEEKAPLSDFFLQEFLFARKLIDVYPSEIQDDFRKCEKLLLSIDSSLIEQFTQLFQRKEEICSREPQQRYVINHPGQSNEVNLELRQIEDEIQNQIKRINNKLQ